jgi:hypothetical protein
LSLSKGQVEVVGKTLISKTILSGVEGWFFLLSTVENPEPFVLPKG